MDIKLVRPFIDAACSVISAETGEPVKAAKVGIKTAPMAGGDITVVLGVAGELRGTVALMMPFGTAMSLLERMTGEPQDSFDTMGESAIAEIANVISGQAGTQLAAGGHEMTISPPTVLSSSGDTKLSTQQSQVYSIGLQTTCGDVELDLALADAPISDN